MIPPAELRDLARRKPVKDTGHIDVEFACGCSVEVTPEWTFRFWQCTAGDECPAWRAIQARLEACVRQLRVQALSGAILPVTGAGQGAGGSL